MAGYGIPQPDIAAVVGISPRTLRKYYAEELATATAKANAKVAETLYRKATNADITGPTVTAAIFWLKTRAGWRETTSIEHSGPDGGPIQTEETTARDAIARKLSSLSARSGAGEDTGGSD
jgi:hypothetical protein